MNVTETMIKNILQKLEPKERELIEQHIEITELNARIKEKQVFIEQMELITKAHDSAVKYLEANNTIQ